MIEQFDNLNQMIDTDSCKQVLFTFVLAPACFLEQIPQYALCLKSELGCMRSKHFWGASEHIHQLAVIKAYMQNRVLAERNSMGKIKNTTQHWTNKETKKER